MKGRLFPRAKVLFREGVRRGLVRWEVSRGCEILCIIWCDVPYVFWGGSLRAT